jgi:hypothetical protein
VLFCRRDGLNAEQGGELSALSQKISEGGTGDGFRAGKLLIQRVDVAAISLERVVEMGASAQSGIAREADDLLLTDPGALVHAGTEA